MQSWIQIQSDEEFDSRGVLRKSDPDFIFARAMQLFRGEKRCGKEEEDRMIDHLLNFFYLSQTGKASDKKTMRTVYRGIYLAYDLWRSPHWAKPLSIECGILANASSEQIAQAIGDCKTCAVKTYEKLFFDVRDNLNDPMFVVQDVIGISQQMSSGLDRKTKKIDLVRPERLHKLVAYIVGWDNYKKFVGMPSEDSQETMKALRQIVNDHEAFKVAFSVLKEGVGPVNIPVILERFVNTGSERTEIADEEEQEYFEKTKNLILENPMDARTANPEDYQEKVELVPAALPGEQERHIEDEREDTGR